MFKKRIAVERLNKAGEVNINTKKVPNGLENAIKEYIKNGAFIHLLSHKDDIKPNLLNKEFNMIKINPNSIIGKVVGFDDNNVYFEPSNKYVKDMIDSKSRVLFIYNANNTGNDSNVEDVILIYIQKETQEQLERDTKSKDEIIRDGINKRINFVPSHDYTSVVKVIDDNLLENFDIINDIISKSDDNLDHNIKGNMFKSSFIKPELIEGENINERAENNDCQE